MLKPKLLWWPLLGAGAAGFSIGACAHRTPDSAGVPLESRASAQGAAPAHGTQDLRRLSTTYSAIARQVTPAVVNINSQQIIPGRVLRDPFSNLFGDDPFGGGGTFQEPARRTQSLGSGVIVDGRGIIVTNHHVINNANTITVTLTDRRRMRARLLGSDPASDVAVLKIEAANLPVLQWADSERLQVGEIVLAIGSPFNLASTVTQGIISAKGRRDLGISDYEDFLQTDAAINPGNSGGALVDIDGRLIGINTAILSESGGNQGIGLAIPSQVVKKISSQLLASGHVTRGWLGIVVEPITEDVAAQLNLGEARGVLVTGVYPQGPAAELQWARAGGNVITSVNGTPVDSPGQFRNLVADLKPGSAVAMQVAQNGKTHDFNVTLGRRPDGAKGV